MPRDLIRLRTVAVGMLAGMLLTAEPSAAQQPARSADSAQAPPAAPPAAPPTDSLGRDTPRGTLLRFLDAVRKGNHKVSPLYLDTDLTGDDAIELARQLYVVIDSRLPPRLHDLSDRPEGSQANPLHPDQDVIGTIQLASGPLDLIVERVNRGEAGTIWLFSRTTLGHIPGAYWEVHFLSLDRYLPNFLGKWRIAGVRLFGWLSLLLVVPLGYRFFGLVAALLRPIWVFCRRRYHWDDLSMEFLSGPVQLFALAISIRWIISALEVPLRERQFWATVVVILATTSVTWLLLRLSAGGERYVYRRLDTRTAGEMAAMLRLARRAGEVLIIAAAVLVLLRYFGLNPSAALAGLGIGGIAVALAAQKTLENVVGGLSIVFDKVVRVGDTLKVGETIGTVDYVGLRSTRIRTLDRTIVSVPNGQIANVNIETLSARDKFWFRHVLSLRQETTSSQVRAVVENVRALLAGCPGIDPSAVRARFFRLGPFSLDIEVVAYIFASDWGEFLDIQQDLLLRVMEIVEREGTAIALPSQRLTLADARAAASLPR